MSNIHPEVYYDRCGNQILEGDLLEVFHFRSVHRRKKHYMYQVVTLENGFLRARDFSSNKSHYGLRGVMLNNYYLSARVLSRDNSLTNFDDPDDIRSKPLKSTPIRLI